MKVLHLTIKKKFFDMIFSSDPNRKVCEYREIKPYWLKRLGGISSPKNFDAVHFYNGGSPSTKYPNGLVKWEGLSIGSAVPEWSDNWKGDVFRIHLGEIIKHPNEN